MKGIELPVNVLVIIAIAVLVLLGLVALYVASLQGIGPLSVITAKGSACSELVNRGCENTDPSDIYLGIDISGDGTVTQADDNLYQLCIRHLGVSETIEDNPNTPENEAEDYDPSLECKRVCSCPGIR